MQAGGSRAILGAAGAFTSTTTRRLTETCLVFLVFLLPGLLGGRTTGDQTVTIGPALLPVLVTALPEIGFVVYLLFLQGEVGRPELGLTPPRARHFLAAALVALLMIAILALARSALALSPAAVRERLAQGTRFRLAGWQEVPAAVVFCVAASAREELLYRAYLYVRLMDLGVPSPVALLAATALFAAAHAYQGLLAVALAVLQGLLLGAVFVRMRNIAVPVLAHAAHNLAVLILALLPGAPLGI